jgi:hypothetical protein
MRGRYITRAMMWLVQEAQPGDELFFSYSGHGSSRTDVDGDEVDGMDEVIVPMDYITDEYGCVVDRFISDDTIYKTM